MLLSNEHIMAKLYGDVTLKNKRETLIYSDKFTSKAPK